MQACTKACDDDQACEKACDTRYPAAAAVRQEFLTCGTIFCDICAQ